MGGRRIVLALALALSSLQAVGAQESTFGAGSLEDRYFRVEAAVEAGRQGPVAEGYVVNRYNYHATRVGVALEAVDAGGRSLGTVRTSVGDVPANYRTFFRVPLPPGATAVRAVVTDYQWAPRGG